MDSQTVLGNGCLCRGGVRTATYHTEVYRVFLFRQQRILPVSDLLLLSCFYYSDFGYTSLNPIVLCIIMGLRQLFPMRSLDTRIPFIKGTLLIPFSFLPQLYIIGYYLLCFTLELSGTWYDLRLPFVLYASWFYLRFLMVHPATGDVGDSAEAFSLYTFFPEKYRSNVKELSDGVFLAVNNSTGAFDYIQRRFRSPFQHTSVVDRKK